MNNSYNYYKILKIILMEKLIHGLSNGFFMFSFIFGKTIYPNISLTRNNGFDGDGSNTFRKKKYFGNISKDSKFSILVNLLLI